ncbi:MAG: ribosome biogenesis GTP-binding protein YihA/YsxC [Candidatus Electrothrix aestuarii]|uniref:Probable GTP-binding protein EngB n=1 Tax=Candidatus Electrothrix aestuarii TaxID=3062594 RepID=A0AAU8LQ66_9BACT|nr:ribosome biogenesis GTP-binding protein YihA/YsxC [Candidatus Electrothrix aestuarii]WPD24391.1 MAG: ribosome biogenesis GTP-binding protein YihA/YsxC [Candidatus Electrothrix sp. GW3-3]
MINFNQVSFVDSVFSLRQLPEPLYPEIAFAGRSNVGKSSLINKLVNRKNLVKTSSKPGKTRSLNFFEVKEQLYLVDLPGYGFAQVNKQMRSDWEVLISGYLLERETLACVVVIIDLRHSLKNTDREMLDWLQYNNIPSLPVYTKADKLSKNKQAKQAAALDAALNIAPTDRLLFSAKSGLGCQELQNKLAAFCREELVEETPQQDSETGE